MYCGIAIFPSKEIQDAANSFRKRYDPHYNLIQPHLTIKEKEQWNEDQLAAAAAHLEQITKSIQPFEIHFNRFSSFYPVNNVIYLALSDTTEMIKLHNTICTDVCRESEKPYAYNPHLTIGQELGADELHDVLSSLKNRKVNLTSKVDRVHLLFQTDNEAWTVHQTFLLRG
ncbi:2'-5' RNA ligase family protein [Paenibacillus hexagrammi]|uniref:Putative phosphoesterase L0M14_08655 n=1 Tax=Paenibacillus hexagrammi TaxID=2908839 RepID=A0ABY3SNQ3_9BACL|nr:2'-5' RNA ligase family protein [Paenibacillus sp. YPD9-1]UJF35180.1 2'-5' RNA ligase family protein [Paenibacillus sp. YPD9-1]